MAQDAGVMSVDEGAFHALWRSFAMIIFSEIGDKTFLIAAILAMRHPRLIVFAGAFGSLVVMSILSAELGHLLPTLIPRKWTQICAAVLFLVFGLKMLQEGREMKAGNEKLQEEMKEAEEDIEGDDAAHDGEDGLPLEAMEAGTAPGHVRRRSSSASRKKSVQGYMEASRNFFSYLLGPVFVQAFVLTFLGEWGDRSQISTIALAAADNVYVVAFGTVIGHSCCTALAVMGGRYVSTKISVKHAVIRRPAKKHALDDATLKGGEYGKQTIADGPSATFGPINVRITGESIQHASAVGD
ncbi:GDT1-like protein C17G8.08c [Trametes pubescens]|uniref:GDT1 family protein n=1 Tax=Trametes pubescens TaxID=154538 RepID=A0A1M2W6Z3_TRAPU|nr:GDT1-like protein C17G8.08c [Trametes pubescens]